MPDYSSENNLDCLTTYKHVQNCKHCFRKLGRMFRALNSAKAGATTSPAKARAARLNGAKSGGRPKEG